MIGNLVGLDFDEAYLFLEANGYTRISEGDWAYVYATPAPDRVVRLTPYDPAYLFFVHLCAASPHQHLPTHHAIIRLAGSGYAVEMPRYVAGDISRRAAFLDALKTAMVAEEDSSELASLAQILKRGIAAGEILVPYFGGIDWNVDNVMLDGDIPKLVDGFWQTGALIAKDITEGVPSAMKQNEVAGFLTLPYYRRGQKQYGE